MNGISFPLWGYVEMRVPSGMCVWWSSGEVMLTIAALFFYGVLNTYSHTL